MAINLDKVVAGVPLKVWLIGGGVALGGGLYLRSRSKGGTEEEPLDDSGVLPVRAVSGASDFPEEGNAPPPRPAPPAPAPPRQKPVYNHTHCHRHPRAIPGHAKKGTRHSHRHRKYKYGGRHHRIDAKGKC